MAAPNGMNFGKVPRVFLSMKLIQKSNFRVQGMFFNNCIEKNQNKTHFEEGTSEPPPPPPLELFRKFIRFGTLTRPVDWYDY